MSKLEVGFFVTIGVFGGAQRSSVWCSFYSAKEWPSIAAAWQETDDHADKLRNLDGF